MIYVILITGVALCNIAQLYIAFRLYLIDRKITRLKREKEEDRKRLNVGYLMVLHNLTEKEAGLLLAYCKEKSIVYKECYGDGSIMFHQWQAHKESTK